MKIIRSLLLMKLLPPIVIGVLGFILVVGTPTLNFQNIAWLSSGDPLFNYVGWEIFRHGPWTNPMGLNPNYGLEFSSSIVYSDSIPLLAIFFKILSNFLGEPFQYFGFWLLICFLLQSIFGHKLSELLTKNKWLQIFITTIFVFTPVMLFRMNVHLALAGHFVLLWALFLNLKKNTSSWSWALLIFVALGIHFYLFFMVFFLWAGSLMDRRISKQNMGFGPFATEVLLVLIVISISAWQYGYLAISVGSSSALGYGGDQFNLMAFFNVLGWSQFMGSNIFTPSTLEGFAYMGAGVIAAVIFGLLQLIRKDERKRLFQKTHSYKFLLSAIIIMLLISITNNVDIGNSHYQIPINESLLFALNIVRSSGRLSWPMQYLIIYIAFWLIINGYKKWLIPLFAMLCILQVIDTSRGWNNLHKYFFNSKGPKIEHSLTHEFWSEAPKQYSTIKIFPPQNWPNGWNIFAAYAVQNKFSTNSVFLARVDERKVFEASESTNLELSEGNLDPKTIYIFQKWSNYPHKINLNYDSSRDLFAKINGVVVLAPNYKVCRDCKQQASSLEISSLVPKLKIGEVIKFAKGDDGGEFLLDGWTHADPWGTWSSGTASTMAIPLGSNAPSKIQISFRALVGPKHPASTLKVFAGGEYQKTIQVTKQLNNSMTISVPIKFRHDKFILLKFEYTNPTSPKDAGYGNLDDRLLTLGIESMQLLR